MTDKEIIKAFRCYYLNEDLCEECPCFKDEKCTDMEDVYNIPKQIIDLINRQQAEFDRLRSMNQAKLDMIHDLRAELETAKAEAIKEFQNTSRNMLIELYKKYHDTANPPKKETDMFYQGRAEAIWECIIVNDTLVKEMTEGNC